MSMNTPIGSITQTTAIKDFVELENIDTQQYLLGINNIATGDGSKIKLEKILEDSISADTGNTLEIGSDNKLLNIEEDTGVEAGAYPYPQNLVVNSKGRIESVISGSPASVPIATTLQAGIVKPDGNTITVANDGTINANILGYEIGDIVIRNTPTNDAGKHLLDGALIQYGSYQAFVDYIAGLVTDYPNLFVAESDWQTAVATYGVCGKFVYDSVNNTVRLPKITGIVEGTTDLTALGDLVEAGLPDHRHSLMERKAYTSGTANFAAHMDGTDANYTGYASESNPIYGNSSTVQPQTIKVLYYIVIATTAKTDIEVNIDEIATDLNGKADVDGSNMDNSVKNFDGAWVASSLTAFSNVTLTTTSRTVDLSSYLPNDGYDYLVCATVLGKPNTAGIIAIVSGGYDTQIRTGGAVQNVNAESSGYVVVGSDRTVQCATLSGTWTGAELRLFAYRRIGTNQ